MRHLHERRTRGDRERQQKAEAGGRVPPLPEEERRRDRRARARRARDDGQGLCQADHERLAERHAFAVARPSGAAIGGPEHDTHERHHQRDQARSPERRLRPLVQQQAGERAGDRGHGQVHEQTRVAILEHAAAGQRAEEGHDHAQPVAPEGRRDGRQRPEVEGHVERETAVRPAEEPRHDDQVPRAADRQELAETLQDAEDESARRRHLSDASSPFARTSG